MSIVAVGDTVRIVRDEVPDLRGRVGTLDKFGPDGTTAWVSLGPLPIEGVWCSVSALEKVAR